MIEIVFGESACGSLKIAQTYGKGKYRGSAVSIFMRHEDGSVPSSDEMKKAQDVYKRQCEKLTVFFYPQNQKRRSITMTKPKTLDQLQAEKEQAETQLAQEQHKLERLENRKKYLEKGERTKRTHRLCNLGGTIESLAPEVKDLTRTEMTELMEHIFSLSEVQRAVRHMAITHTNQANREKELKADGTISSERHAD